MAMQWRTLSFPLGRGGLDAKSAPSWMPFGKFETLKNCDLTNPGVLKKRVGFTAQTMSILGGGTLGSGSTYVINRLANRKDELVVFSDNIAESANSSKSVMTKYGQSGSGWIPQSGGLIPIHVSHRRPTSFQGDARTQDHAASSTLSVYAWEDGAGAVKYTAVDTTGKRGNAVSSISNAIRPRVVAYGASGQVWLFWVDSSTWEIKVRKFTPGSSSTSDTTLLSGVINSATTSSYDVVVTGSTAIIAFVTSTANTIKVRIVDTTPAVSATTYDWAHGTANADCCAIAVDTENGNVGVVASVGGSILGVIRTSALGAVLATTTISANGARNVTCAFLTSNNSLFVLFEGTSGGVDGAVVTTGGSATDLSTLHSDCGLASRLINRGDGLVVLLVFPGTAQPTYFIYAPDPTDGGGQVIGRILPGTAGNTTVRAGHLPQIQALGSDEYFVALLKASFLESKPTATADNSVRARRQVVGASLKFKPDTAYCTAMLGESLYIAGAQLSRYDGTNVHDVGFYNFPVAPSPAYSNGAGSIPNGTYYYRFYFESYNSQGERELSTFLAATSAVLTGANDTVSFTFDSVPLMKNFTRDVGIAVYRTAVNPTASSPFYRVSSTDPTSTGLNCFLDVNAIAAWSDGMTDTTLATQELDYQNPDSTGASELDNIPPPPCRVLAASGTRLFLGGLEDGNQVWASKIRYSGQMAAFNDTLVIDTPDDGGDVSALAVQDNVLLIFKASKVYAVDATGPDNFGNGQQFGEPKLIAGDVGAIDWRSVCVAKPGVFFQSKKGVYLITRQLQVVYVGADAESYFNGATVLSVCAPVGQNHVRFQLSTRTMIYDYELGIWMEHTDPGTKGQVSFVDSTGAAKLYIASSTKVLVQDSTVWTDDSSSYEMRFKTGVLSFGGLQNYVRVREILLDGTYKSAHTSNLSLYYNGATSSPTNYTRAMSAAPYQTRVKPAVQKLERLQIEWYESSGSGTGQVAELNEILLEVGQKQGPFTLPSAQSI